jgi:hypothetical protein
MHPMHFVPPEPPTTLKRSQGDGEDVCIVKDSWKVTRMHGPSGRRVEYASEIPLGATAFMSSSIIFGFIFVSSVRDL